MSKVSVLIVDDSALVRQMLSQILGADSAIEVVGTASDPYVARDKIKQLNPDVLTLDVEMPRMDGVTFLGNLMRLRPMPVVMISSLTEKGADITLRALELGAVDFVAKPKVDVAHGLEEYALEITAKVKAAARAQVRALSRQPSAVASTGTGDVVAAPAGGTASTSHFRTTDRIIAIGSSTGGTEAVRDVLSQMPANSPAVVITQHIPAAFSGPFAQRLDNASKMVVCEASDGQQILPGHAYVAPGDHHLTVVRDGARFVCRLDDGAPVNRHKPAVDVMFDSLARNVGHNAIAVLLTGMGQDGATGMQAMQAQGCPTVAQDERTSVVWGMPGEAVKRGCVDTVLPLHDIAARLVELASA